MSVRLVACMCVLLAACGHKARDRRQHEASTIEDELRKAGQAAKVATRGEDADTLVLSGTDCDDLSIEMTAKQLDKANLGFRRVECETGASVRGADLPYVRDPAIDLKWKLEHAAKALKTAYITNAQYPADDAGPTPNTRCCAAPDHLCPITKDWSKSAAWQSLDFQIDEPGHFQWSYRCTAKTDGHCDEAVIIAVGQFRCDGSDSEWRVIATSPNGVPMVNISGPGTQGAPQGSW